MPILLRLLIIAVTVLLAAVDTGSAANTSQHRHPARVVRAAPVQGPVQGPWCLYYHAGGANCRFGDFQGCMYAASAYGGNCQLSPSWRARYGEQLPPLERWIYGGTPDYCFGINDARCY